LWQLVLKGGIKTGGFRAAGRDKVIVGRANFSVYLFLCNAEASEETAKSSIFPGHCLRRLLHLHCGCNTTPLVFLDALLQTVDELFALCARAALIVADSYRGWGSSALGGISMQLEAGDSGSARTLLDMMDTGGQKLP
jgi:hypothetical protein